MPGICHRKSGHRDLHDEREILRVGVSVEQVAWAPPDDGHAMARLADLLEMLLQ
jgi:hypothetical protein